MPELPAGTVTLLFTDVEGSTRLLQQLGEGYQAVIADHHLAHCDRARLLIAVDARPRWPKRDLERQAKGTRCPGVVGANRLTRLAVSLQAHRLGQARVDGGREE